RGETAARPRGGPPGRLGLERRHRTGAVEREPRADPWPPPGRLWSENLEPIHGLRRGGFAGTLEGFQALVHPDDRARVNEAIRRAREEGSGYVEFRNAWPDGSVHTMEVKGRVLRDAEGRPVRMLGTAIDVTERRRLEDELRRH